MSHYTVVFFIIAFIASMLGFAGVAGLPAQIGWIFAVIAIIFVAVALMGSQHGPISPR